MRWKKKDSRDLVILDYFSSAFVKGRGSFVYFLLFTFLLMIDLPKLSSKSVLYSTAVGYGPISE